MHNMAMMASEVHTLRMAAFNIIPPESFSCTQLTNWLQWIQCFDYFHQMSGLVTSTKLTYLPIHSMNTKVEDISLSFQLTGQEAKKYTTLL